MWCTSHEEGLPCCAVKALHSHPRPFAAPAKRRNPRNSWKRSHRHCLNPLLSGAKDRIRRNILLTKPRCKTSELFQPRAFEIRARWQLRSFLRDNFFGCFSQVGSPRAHSWQNRGVSTRDLVETATNWPSFGRIAVVRSTAVLKPALFEAPASQ